MHRSDFVASRALVVLLAVYCAAPLSVAGNAERQAKPGEVVRVEPVKQLRENLDLWPLVVEPKSAVQRRVNETLRQWNKQLAKDEQACVENLRASFHSVAVDDNSRTVTVTMQGPRFLSMIAEEGFYCGGGHPDGDKIVLVFDLQTGAAVNWAALNPSASTTSQSPDPTKGVDAVAVVLPALRSLYVSVAPDYCKDAYDVGQRFILWPDAESGTLIAEAAWLAHVDAPCVNDLKLTMEEARALGFNESLLSAIEQAHRAFVTKPKPGGH